MPYIPNVVGNADLSAETLTAIGSDIGLNVEVITDNVMTLYTYGNAVLAETSMMNRWCKTIVNKIVRTRLIDTMYKNRLNDAFKGVLDIGDGVEEIFTAPANVHFQGPGGSESPANPYDADMPKVYAAWHVTNAHMKYSVRISRKRLRQAFTSFSALDGFIQYLVDTVYNGYEWDCQILTKFKLAQVALARIGAGAVETVEDPRTGDGTGLLAGVRTYAEAFKWMSDKYNDAGVPTHTADGRIYTTMPISVGAHVDVKDLAAAFNLTYADFIGKKMPIDTFEFTTAEKNRIMEIAQLDSWIFDETDVANLATVLAVIFDIDLLQIYDEHEPELWDNPNGAEAEINYWLHCDRIYSISPFANAVVFVAGGDTEEVIVTP